VLAHQSKSGPELVSFDIPDDARIGDRIPVSGYALITSLGATVSDSWGGDGHAVEVKDVEARFRLVDVTREDS
jgi:hypothetical protein